MSSEAMENTEGESTIHCHYIIGSKRPTQG